MSRFEAFKRMVESEKLDREIEAQAVADRRRERLQQIVSEGQAVFGKRKRFEKPKGPPAPPAGYVTITDFSRRTGCAKQTVLNNIYANRLQAIKDENGHWAIPVEEIQRRIQA